MLSKKSVPESHRLLFIAGPRHTGKSALTERLIKRFNFTNVVDYRQTAIRMAAHIYRKILPDSFGEDLSIADIETMIYDGTIPSTNWQGSRQITIPGHIHMIRGIIESGLDVHGSKWWAALMTQQLVNSGLDDSSKSFLIEGELDRETIKTLKDLGFKGVIIDREVKHLLILNQMTDPRTTYQSNPEWFDIHLRFDDGEDTNFEVVENSILGITFSPCL